MGQKANIPARPFLPFKDGDIPNDLKEDIKETILSHLSLGDDYSLIAVYKRGNFHYHI